MSEQKEKSPFMQAVQEHAEALGAFINENEKKSLLIIAVENDGTHTGTTIAVEGDGVCLVDGLLSFANQEETGKLYNKANKIMALTKLRSILCDDDDDEADDTDNNETAE